MRPRLDHGIPEWADRDAMFFITICALNRNENTFCLPEIGQIILDSIRWRNEQKIWYCELAVLMPDHVHLVLNFPDETGMPKVIRDWKSWLAKKHAILWQENYFDHRLRGDEQYGEKALYVLQNPVRAGFVKRPEDWSYLWLPSWYEAIS
jgi:putative transposase